MQLPLCGNLAKRKTLRANRQAAIITTTTAATTTTTTTATTMEIYPLPRMVKNIGPRKPVLPEGLQNSIKEGNRGSLNSSRPRGKLRRFKFPANSKLLTPCPPDPRSRQQISVFPPSIPHTKTEIVRLFPKLRLHLTKTSCPPPHDQQVAKITTPSDLLL